MAKKKNVERPRKLHTSVRVTSYELEKAREIAKAMNMKISEYFTMILHDGNKEYGKRYA